MDGGAEGGDGVWAFGDEFLADEALVAAFCDGAHDGRVVDFLVVVEFVTAGISCGVDVADEGCAFLVPADDIAVHDLDVVDVEEHFHAFGGDFAADVEGVVDVVAPVIGVALHGFVDAGVEHLEAERDFFFLGVGDDFLEAVDHVAACGVVGEGAAEA